MRLEKLTFGVGDRFAHQAVAQLRAFQEMAEMGVDVVPVWDKSNREHRFVGSVAASVKAAARVAVEQLGWRNSWYAVRLSRFPNDAPGPMKITRARVRIGDKIDEKHIDSSASSVTFHVNLPAGETRLQTWLSDAESGLQQGAYFVEIEHLP